MWCGGSLPAGLAEMMVRYRKGHAMHRQRYRPRAVVCPGKGIAEYNAELKKKLYAVKVTLGDHLLAEGVVELPSEPDNKERADGEA